MGSPRVTVPFVVIAAFVLAGATCNKAPKDEVSTKPSPVSAGPGGAKPEGAPRVPVGGDPSVVSDIPGMDFSSLPESARAQLAQVFTDEFCYCGCPHTLGACLKQHTGCRHARRMATLAAREAVDGVPGVEIILGLGKYYESFRAPRASFKVDPRQCMGAADAAVTLVEFSDFECPYCGAARPMLEKFARANGSRVKLCYAPFPLEKAHPNAIIAGQAALFARDHGKFWEMHDALFENQLTLSRPVIKEIAAKLSLDVAALEAAMDSGKYVDELNASKAAGKTAGVDSTPSVYVNGRKLTLPLATDTLAHTADDEVEWSSNGNAWAAD